MPAALIKSLSRNSGVPVDKVEQHWEQAKKIVADQYRKNATQPVYWALVTSITKKMLGLNENNSFKNFISDFKLLSEDSSEFLKYEQLAASQVVKLIKQHCSDAAWMVSTNSPIYRGESDGSIAAQVLKTGCAVVDPSKSERISRNTSNYYTMILDNHPGRTDFPKRSRSLICTMDEQYAASHSHNANPVIIIPYNGVKIGMVNKKDIWYTVIDLFGKSARIQSFNELWQRLGLSDRDWSSFVNFAQSLKNANESAISAFAEVFGMPESKVFSMHYDQEFLENIFNAYSAEKTGHTAVTSASLPHGEKTSEVWVGGPCIAISAELWPHVRAAYKD